jgi:hypothetical protein
MDPALLEGVNGAAILAALNSVGMELSSGIQGVVSQENVQGFLSMACSYCYTSAIMVVAGKRNCCRLYRRQRSGIGSNAKKLLWSLAYCTILDRLESP